MRKALVRGMASALFLLLAGCAGSLGAGSSHETGEPLVLDLAAGTATTPEWTSKASDCSDDIYACVLVPERMAIIFPRRCSDAKGAAVTQFGSLKVVAPTPHKGLPSGSYVLDTFRNVLLFYDANVGFDRVRLVRASPYDARFDPNDFSAEYRVAVKGQPHFFRCS